VAGIVKGFNFSLDYVLYEMSYANIIMYGSVLPSYNSRQKDSEGRADVIRADDPKNRNIVKKILFG
jgi:hypothetical protein